MLLQVAQSVGSSVHYAQLCHLTAHSSVTLLASLQQGSIALRVITVQAKRGASLPRAHRRSDQRALFTCPL